jgi:hypothetical protein
MHANSDKISLNLKKRIIDKRTFLTYALSTLRVGDPDPNLPDPHVYGPPGSGSRSISQRHGSGSGSFPFLIKDVEQTEIMLAK